MLDWLRDTALTHGTINQSDLDMLNLTDDVDEAVALMVPSATTKRRAGRPMIWFFAILIVLALGGVAVVASGRGSRWRRRTTTPPTRWSPATGRVTADDLRRIRFPLAVRGYRMAEVDALLERLAEEREALDATAADVGPPPDAPPAPPEAPTSPSPRRQMTPTRRRRHTERL